MKDVSEILAKCLQRLEAPFSREWLADFSNLIQFIQTNSLTMHILEEIKKGRAGAHTALIQNLRGLFEDGRKCLKEIEELLVIKHIVSSSIRGLLKFKAILKEIDNPFSELESIYKINITWILFLWYESLLKRIQMPSSQNIVRC